MMTHEVALEKMKSYCAYRERCQQEVKQKLAQLTVYGEQAELVIIDLITQNFLNEERYARAYVSGKFRIKKWGKQKIKQGLKAKGISDKCIQLGFQEIDNEEYYVTIQRWVEKLNVKYKQLPDFDRKGKIVRFLSLKGYEKEQVWDIL